MPTTSPNLFEARRLHSLFSFALLFGITLIKPLSSQAGGTVTNCTEANLDSALVGGGKVTFACDGAIILTSTKVISTNVVLDATGRLIILSGGDSNQLFNVSSNAGLTLLALTIASGTTGTNGGAIYNAGNFAATNCTFTNNSAIGANGINGTNGADHPNSDGEPGGNGTAASGGSGGAIYNIGTGSVVSCLFTMNSAVGGNGGSGGKGGNVTSSLSATHTGGNGGTSMPGANGLGGAIYNAGTFAVISCQFQTNSANGGIGGNGGSGGFSLQNRGGQGADASGGGSVFGGAIYSAGSLSVLSSTFVGNQAAAGHGGDGGNSGSGSVNGREGNGGNGGDGSGAAVYSSGTSTFSRCTFYANTGIGANGGWGGWYAGGASPANGATGGAGGWALGGGIFNTSTNSVVNCTFFANTLVGGIGGVGQQGASHNGAGGIGGTVGGGGLYSTNYVGATNCTFSSCNISAGAGGTSLMGGPASPSGTNQGANIDCGGGTFILENSIIAYFTNYGNAFGTFVDAGFNICSDNKIAITTTTSRTNTDPKLSLLAENGGPTKTCALLSGSPAIDAATNAAAPPLDQRGFFRSGAADIGACEYNGSPAWMRALGQAASLDGEVGMFLIAGPVGGASSPITINYTLSGTASNGVDYVQLTNYVTIPLGGSYAEVLVRGIPGAFTGTNKTVILTIIPSEQYLPTNQPSDTVILFDHDTFDASRRYSRGTSTAFDFRSFVIPIDFSRGVPLDLVLGNAASLFPGNSWWDSFYHIDATNYGNQNFTSNRILLKNPIVAFGSPVGGSPLYLNQPYSFGIYAGDCSNSLSDAIRIQVYYRSNSAYVNAISLPLPDFADTNQLATFVTNGFTVTAEQFGLRTTLFDTPGYRWGVRSGGKYVLNHTATSAIATNYYYVVEVKGRGPFNYLVLDGTGSPAWSKLYVMEFSPVPPGRPAFVDAPHFDGNPLPPEYQGKSLQELTNITATLPDLSSLVASSFLTIDGSPELRRHPVLDQFVKDMGGDPLALANFVLNEIDLTDMMDYDTNFNGLSAVNLGGVRRSALGTFQEGQGSPVEQCALLVYLLRQAGIPAAYIYPTNGGLQMLDSQLSKLLGIQLKGALNPLGQTNLPRQITVNYPWVAAHIGSNWVQIFPWMKDMEVIEGFDLYDYMPTNYNTGYKWMSRFLANDTNIFSGSTSDQPIDLFPLFIQNTLNSNYPGLSVDDMGVQIVNRKHLYAQWDDLPRPFNISGIPLPVESLSTNLNLFDTIQIRVYSLLNPSKLIDTGEMFLADVHNRKLLLKYFQIGTSNVHDMILSLSAYSTNQINQTNFGILSNPTWKLVTTNRLNSSDNPIAFELTQRRLRFLPAKYPIPTTSIISNLWGFSYFANGAVQPGHIYQSTDIFKKGDLVTFCLDVGRVSQKMLNVQAQEIWTFSRKATTNDSSTLDFDVYAGTTTYLMGMSYFNYLDRFTALNERLHKVRFISMNHSGFGLLQAQRDANGNLLSGGAVILLQPALHIPNNGQSFIFNNSLKPSSSRDFSSSNFDWWLIEGLQASGAEHAILESFFKVNAVSSIKLLRQQGKVELNRDNFSAAGDVIYNGVKLKDSDANLWSTVTNFFLLNAYESEAYLTPGIVTNGTFVGVAGLLYNNVEFDSPVGGYNGGISDNLATSTYTSQNAVNITVVPAPEGSATPFQLLSAAAESNPTYQVNGATAYWSESSTGTKLANNQVQLDPTLGSLGNQLSGLSLDAVNSAAIYNTLYNSGTVATKTSFFSDPIGFIAEPVDVMTGEFYVDATDLTLPGPMPLRIRRNYGSQNLSENEFGFGWKLCYVPFLSLSTNSLLIYAAEMDGSVLAYRQTGTNVNLWLPQASDNPTLNNHSSMGIGSIGNLFNNQITLSTASGTNVFTLRGADGSVRTFTQRSYAVGGYSRQRPYLERWEDNRGNSYDFQYGTDITQSDYGEVRRIQSSNGDFLGFYYDIYGHIIEAYTGDGRRLAYEYDHFSDLVSVTLPDESQINYRYQHLNSITNGVTNVYSTHLILEELKPDSRILKNDYDSLRRVTNQYATVGVDLKPVRNATFRYTNNFALGSTNVLTGTTTILDYTNRPATYYYTNSLIRKILDPLNQTVVQDWYETNTVGGYRRSLKSYTDKRGLQTSYSYDIYGNLTNATTTGDLLGTGSTVSATTLVTYNSSNLPLLITDPVSNKIGYVYDTTFTFLPQQIIKYVGSIPVATNFISYVNVTNTETIGTNQVTHIAFGLLQQRIRAYGSPDAATSSILSDGRGFPTNGIQVTGTSDPNITNRLLFNGRGELVLRTDAAGRRYRFLFDPLGRLAGRETYEASQSLPMYWDYQYYNKNGELVWSDGPRFNPEDYVWRDYDGAGRRIVEVRWRSQANMGGTGTESPGEDALYGATLAEYDPFGNLTKVTDPLGNYVRMDYDSIGQLLQKRWYSSTDVIMATNTFGHEPGGLVSFETNALGGVTKYIYTSRGQLKARFNADASTNGWVYYLDGRVYREFQRNGAYWETTYEDANRRSIKIFYSSGGSPLATNVAEFDRRGNLVRQIDAGGFSSTNFFDGLDRLKWSIGPVISYQLPTNVPPPPGGGPPSVRQTSTNFYDAAGLVVTNVNALGEKMITFFDALGRTTRTEIRSSENALVRERSLQYAINHHSVTITNGSGVNAIVSTTFTDNNGKPLLSIAYPSANSREFTRRVYDISENLTFEGRYAATNTATTFFSGKAIYYDGLNRPRLQYDRDDALTTFDYDAAGNLTNRVMPGGTLKWQATYNNAGQITKEWNANTSGGGTRTNTYMYYQVGPFAGLLQTSIDNRSVTCTHLYDDWLRPATNIYSGPSPEHNLITSWRYDSRGFVTSIIEEFTNATIVPTVSIQRSNDAYGLLHSETIIVNGSYFQDGTHMWDSAGRRTGLGFSTTGYAYGWRADGLLASILGQPGGNNYAYTTAGMLSSRTVGSRVTTINSRDGVGRPLSSTAAIFGNNKLTETLTWTGDGLLNTHTLARQDFTDSRSFFYADQSRRLIEERLSLSATQQWTNVFSFDGGTASGPGVLTTAGAPNSTNVSWTGTADAFSRVNYEANTVSHRPAYGRVNGPSTVAASLDGHQTAVTVIGTGNTIWTNLWRALLEISPGPHQLTVAATLPGGLFTTNNSIWFTNSAPYEHTFDTFDGAGNITQRVWRSPSGTTNRTQSLTWDAKGRLRKVIERDGANNGQDWTALFDPFGRRLQTTQIVVTNGVSLSNSPITVSHFFDPQFEFLELGVTENGRTTWKIMGPDLDGRYGGQNGTGGFEAIIPGPGLFCPVINDALGNALAVYDGIHTGLLWATNRVTGYGAIPGYRPPILGTGGGQLGLVWECGWRNRMIESIGYAWLGGNFYDFDGGRFLRFDERGHEGSPTGYQFCGGDPINYFDPDGRYGKIAWDTGVGTLGDIVKIAGTLKALGDWDDRRHWEVTSQFAVQGLIDYINGGGGLSGTRNAVNRYNLLRPLFELGSDKHLIEGPNFGEPLTVEQKLVALSETVSLVAGLAAGLPGTIRAVASDLRALSEIQGFTGVGSGPVNDAAEAAYATIREARMSDVAAVAENSDLTVAEATTLKKHLFFGTHEMPVNAEDWIRMRFTADPEVAYAWKTAVAGELTPEQKLWFRKLADHELAERALMGQGLPYRDPAAFNPKTGGFDKGNSAHDLAPKDSKTGFPGYEHDFEANQ